MKRTTALTLSAFATLIICSVALGQTSTASAGTTLNVPVYSGGKIRAEISLSNEDILPMVKDAIKSVGQKSLGSVPPMLKHLESLDLNTLHEALAGISAVKGVIYELPATESPEAVEEFYLSHAKSAGWNRIIFLKPTPDEKISINIFAKGQEGMLGLIVGKQPKALLVAVGGTQGMPNIQKLVEWGKAAFTKLYEAGALPGPAPLKPKAVPKPPAK
ncbi:MAG: hypothetical protein ACP5R4_00650 [Armatimonadota bacterium]